MPRAARPAAIVLLAALALAGCGDGTGPGNHTPSLALTGPSTPLFEAGQYEDGTPRVECSVQIWAAATGRRAVMLDSGRVHWYALSGNVDMGSDPLSHAELAELFGGERVEPKGDGLTTYLRMWAPSFFRVTLDVFYHADGSLGEHTSHTVQCGNSPPPGQAGVSPTVTAVSILPVGGGSVDALQPGDAIDVTYSVSAPAGATRILFRWDGSRAAPLELHGHWSTTLTATVRTRVPALAELEAPTALRIIAVDDAENSGSAAFAPMTLHDARKPTGSVEVNPAYEVGDTVRLDIRAADNDEISSVVVRLGAPVNMVDSIPLEDSAAVLPWRHAVPAEWSRTAATLSVTVHDKAGNSTELTPGRLVSFYSTVSRPTRSVDWGGGSWTSGTTIDVRRGLVYFAMGAEKRLRIFSLRDGVEQPPVLLPTWPRGLELTPSGDSLVFGLIERGSLGVVDLARDNALSEIPLIDYSPGFPAQVQEMTLVSPARVLAVVTPAFSSFGAKVLDVDLATGTQRFRSEARIGYPFMPVPRPGDRSAAFFQPGPGPGGCVQRYDAASDGFGPCIHVVDRISQPTVDAAGRLLLGDSFVYDAVTFDTVSRIILPNRFGESVIAPDGTVSYVGTFSGYLVVRTSDGAVLEQIRVPMPTDRVTISPDGRTLVVVSSRGTYPGGSLTIVDLAGPAAVVARADAVAPRPGGPAVAPVRASATRATPSPNERATAATKIDRRRGIERAPH